MGNNESGNSSYERYHIDTTNTPEIEKWPSRFDVKVQRFGLAKWLLSEVWHYGPSKMEVIMSRPCLYGVFSGPIGGFAPRPEHCVGCLRCTTEFPEFVKVIHNPSRLELGDDYFNANHVNTVSYESEAGMVPVRGAGYRGKFGGQGWDGMWTDMSEIVRPTRDGIHGREFISTVVDIGYRPNFLSFDDQGRSIGSEPEVISLPLPVIFDTLPPSAAQEKTWRILAETADALQSLSIQPVGEMVKYGLDTRNLVPLIKPEDKEGLGSLKAAPQMIEMEGWDQDLFEQVKEIFPESLVSLRIPYTSAEELLVYSKKGIHIFHLVANYHGRGVDGAFVLDLIQKAHKAFVEAGIRQEVTLIGSGGMIVAEHVPKAILCGLDVVALDTPVLVALQAMFSGSCADRHTSIFSLPRKLTVPWGKQRLMNLVGSWRDQLLEIMGAMGLREVRRLRGELGRAMFMAQLEKEAFAGVDGYENA